MLSHSPALMYHHANDTLRSNKNANNTLPTSTRADTLFTHTHFFFLPTPFFPLGPPSSSCCLFSES